MFRAVVLGLAAIALTGCTRPLDPASGIIAADRAFSAMSAKDGPKAAFDAYCSDDAKLLSSTRSGKAAIAEIFSQLPADPSMTSLTWTPSYADVAASGDLGYSWGRYTLVVKTRVAGGRPIVRMGTYVTVWRKRGGEWRIVLDGGSADGT